MGRGSETIGVVIIALILASLFSVSGVYLTGVVDLRVLDGGLQTAVSIVGAIGLIWLWKLW